MRLALLLLLVPTFALAQTFPARAISIVVPYPPGSSSDLIPRTIAPLMSQSMGVAVIVENRPGAGGNLGAGAMQLLAVPALLGLACVFTARAIPSAAGRIPSAAHERSTTASR